MTVLRAAAETHTGYARAINEDQAVASGDLVAVADGMGGHVGGEVAARMAIEELLAGFSGDRSLAGFLAAVRRANRAVWRRSRVDRGLRGMGTTLTAAALVSDPGTDGSSPHLVLVNIGDSRAYRLSGPGARLERLTEDHSLVEEMVRSGELTPEQAAIHPHRHVLTRVLGVDAEVDPDVFELDPEPGLRLVLCSDGLTNEVSEDEIGELVALTSTPAEAARDLVERALGHGGTDNVTVVVVDVVAEGGYLDAPVELVPAKPVLSDRDMEEADDITQVVPVALAPPAGAQPEVPSAGGSLEPPEAPLPGSPDRRAAGARRRHGRSMAVVAKAPVNGGGGGGGELPGATGEHHRAVVLVPERGFRKTTRDRVLTARTALFVLLLAAVLGGTAGVVVWFNQSSYYVGLAGEHVAIYQGRPGGMLWFKPQLIETVTLRRADLLPATVVALRHGVTESSLPGARQLVRNLVKERQLLIGGASSPVTTTAPSAAGSTTRPAGSRS
ncbi:MAG: protein phosphatase 2C domain-containing protein [Acidimicrobiales bacterium]